MTDCEQTSWQSNDSNHMDENIVFGLRKRIRGDEHCEGIRRIRQRTDTPVVKSYDCELCEFSTVWPHYLKLHVRIISPINAINVVSQLFGNSPWKLI
jgi:hypothetical protein